MCRFHSICLFELEVKVQGLILDLKNSLGEFVGCINAVQPSLVKRLTKVILSLLEYRKDEANGEINNGIK